MARIEFVVILGDVVPPLIPAALTRTSERNGRTAGRHTADSQSFLTSVGRGPYYRDTPQTLRNERLGNSRTRISPPHWSPQSARFPGDNSP